MNATDPYDAARSVAAVRSTSNRSTANRSIPPIALGIPTADRSSLDRRSLAPLLLARTFARAHFRSRCSCYRYRRSLLA